MWLRREGTGPGPAGSGNQNHFPIPRVRGADPRASGPMGQPAAREGAGLGASPDPTLIEAVLTLRMAVRLSLPKD